MKEKTKKVRQYFGSLNEFQTFINETKPIRENVKNGRIFSERESESFTGTPNFEAADEMITAGYPDGLKALKAVTADKTPKRASYDIYKSQIGFLPSVGDVVAGNPVNMYNVRKSVRATTKVIDIVVDSMYSYSTKKEEIERNAVEILTAVARLEKSGYRVGLHFIYGVQHRTSRGAASDEYSTFFIVTLKKANQKLDLYRIAYPALHPSFFRRHCFAVFERLNKIDRCIGRIVDDIHTRIKEINHSLEKSKFIKASEGKTADEIVKLVTE